MALWDKRGDYSASWTLTEISADGGWGMGSPREPRGAWQNPKSHKPTSNHRTRSMVCPRLTSFINNRVPSRSHLVYSSFDDKAERRQEIATAVSKENWYGTQYGLVKKPINI